MDLLLISNGKMPGKGMLEYALDAIKAQVQKTGVKRYLLIPYAVVSSSYDTRVKSLQNTMAKAGCEVVGIHQFDDPVKAIEEAEGIMVSGGNTWVLNKMLHDNNLITPIRKAVLNRNIPYIGWSAGSNIACPSIRTTNDMPIVSSAIIDALALTSLQINPHYIDATISGHMGETRDDRINEFMVVNPSEKVTAIPEGTWIHQTETETTYHSFSSKPMKVFQFGHETQILEDKSDLSFLL
ncbi:Peptidase E [invertebrate metagenome]|uniref:Peptidase E n=1 Tax=invertebrate metagenome TaxID=1711999 RepID=A0A2H9T610_9ZZZZ